MGRMCSKLCSERESGHESSQPIRIAKIPTTSPPPDPQKTPTSITAPANTHNRPPVVPGHQPPSPQTVSPNPQLTSPQTSVPNPQPASPQTAIPSAQPASPQTVVPGPQPPSPQTVVSHPPQVSPQTAVPGAQPASPQTNQKLPSLWEQALSRIPQESIKYPGGKKVPQDIGLAEGFIEEIKRKKDECDSRRWFYIKNEEKVFVVENLLVQLNKYAVVGDLMIQHNPNIVALVWGGFRGLLQVGTTYVEQMRSITESVDYLFQLLCSCHIYEKLYCQETLEISKSLNDSLLNLYTSILKYLCYTYQYLDSKTLARFFKTFSSEMEGLMSEIRSNNAKVEHNIGLAEQEVSKLGRLGQDEQLQIIKSHLETIKKPIESGLRVVELIYTSVKRKRRLKILGWLSRVEYEAHHILSQRRRQEGTGTWLFKNHSFVNWKESKENTILWLRADAGFGKTILASSIIDDFGPLSASDDHAVAYFYCNYKEPDRRDSAAILRTLIKQFCVKHVGQKIPTVIDRLHQDREDKGHANGPLDHEEGTELIISLSEKYQSTTLIIDALDECDIRTRKSLFSSLHNIIQRGFRVKIVVTSRYDQDINNSFASDLCYYIDDKDNSADINLYIDAELDRRCDPNNIHRDYSLILKGEVDPELKAKVRSCLQAKSNGMFMWVNLQIMALCAALTPGGVEEALARMPGTLNETYLQILERIQSQDPNSYRVALIVLKWLLYAQKACTTETIIEALALKPGGVPGLNSDGFSWKVPDILGICKSLVVYDEVLKTFRFAHFSVQEFLVQELTFERVSTNTYIAEVCVTALLHHYKKDSCLVPQLYSYAMEYWGDHVRLAGVTPGALRTLCMDFLRSPVAYEQWGTRVIVSKPILCMPQSEQHTPVVGPLLAASYYGLPDICELLLQDSDAELNSGTKDGFSPLAFASMLGYEQVVMVLLKRKGLDVDEKDKKYLMSPLLLAADRGHDKVVQLLLGTKGVNADGKDGRTGRSPLSWAATKGHDKVVQLLLKRDDVDVNSQSGSRGQGPLSLAVVGGHHEVVRLFLERKDVDVNLQDGWSRRSPLSWAAILGHDSIVRLLLERVELMVDLKDSEVGRSPLSWAADSGHDRVVQLLLRRADVDVNSVDTDSGRSPLSWAAESGHDEVVRLLLQRKDVDVNLQDNELGQSPLSFAAENGYDKLVQLLLEMEDVDVNLKDQCGQSPLSWAADRGHEKVVWLLLQRADVDVNSKDDNGNTPLDLAHMHGHRQVVRQINIFLGIIVGDEDEEEEEEEEYESDAEYASEEDEMDEDVDDVF